MMMAANICRCWEAIVMPRTHGDNILAAVQSRTNDINMVSLLVIYKKTLGRHVEVRMIFAIGLQL